MMVKATFLPSSNAEEAQLTPLLRLGAGACAGIIAMSATYPMDMVRGRLTVQVLFAVLIFNLNVISSSNYCLQSAGLPFHLITLA